MFSAYVSGREDIMLFVQRAKLPWACAKYQWFGVRGEGGFAEIENRLTDC